MGAKRIMMKPTILIEGKYSSLDLSKLKKQKIWKTVDVYDKQLKELAKIRFKKVKKGKGNWLYFPWNGNLVHMVGVKEYFELRTNRNRDLITKEEQTKLSNASVGVLGLSVGGEIAKALVYQGIANNLRVSDYDTLDTTNLNRLRAKVFQVGNKKIDVFAQDVFDINPYLNLDIFDKGVKEVNIVKFLTKKPRLDLAIDEVDDFKIKILLRLKCKKLGIPVLMFTNLGDSVLIDVERYDKDKKLHIFNGRIGDLGEKISKLDIIPKEVEQKIAIGLVGIENVPPRALESVKKIGSTLIGRPQLSSTVTTSSGLASYVVRRILLGENIKSGRYLFKFEDVIV